MTLVAVAANDPEMVEPAPGPLRMFSTSPGATRMTLYGPEGIPGMLPPVVAVGAKPVVGVGAPGVTVGRLMVGVGTVGVGKVGVGAAVVGVARRGVGEGMLIGVGSGIGVRNREIEQPVRTASRLRPDRLKATFFILSFRIK